MSGLGGVTFAQLASLPTNQLVKIIAEANALIEAELRRESVSAGL